MKSIIALLIVYFLSVAGCFAQGSWLQKNDAAGVERTQAVSFVLGEHAYVGTGKNVDGPRKDFWQYTPVTDSWKKIADFPGEARFGAVSFTANGKGYVGTGSSAVNVQGYKDFYAYDPISDTWEKVADFAGTARIGAVAFSLNGKGYVGTGKDIHTEKEDFFEYNPQLNQWKQIAAVAGAKRMDATGFSIDGKGYLAGGYITNEYKSDLWEYDPAVDTWTVKIEDNQLLAEKRSAAGFTLENFAYLVHGEDLKVLGYNPADNTLTERNTFGGKQPKRTGLIAFSVNNLGYAGFGDYTTFFDNVFYKDVYVFDSQNTLPAPEFSAKVLARSVEINWILPLGATGFELERSDGDDQHFKKIQSSPYNGNKYTDYNLSSLTVYYYRIRSYSELGKSEFKTIKVKTKAMTPEIEVLSHSAKHIQLQFTSQDPIQGYVIERSTGSISNFEGIDSVTAERKKPYGATLIDKDIEAGQSYYYRVRTFVKDGESDFTSPKNVNAIEGGGWIRITDYPPSRLSDAVAFYHENKFYAGLNSKFGNGNEFWAYNEVSKQWEKKSDIGGKAADAAASFVIGSKAYVFGGTHGLEVNDNLLEYDFKNDSWLIKGYVPDGGKKGSVAFAIDGIAYIGGGAKPEADGGTRYDQTLNDFWKYDPASDSWERLSDAPFSLAYNPVVVFNNKAYLMYYKDLYEYTPATDQWKQIATAGERITPGYGFESEGKLFFFSQGGFGSEEQPKLWEYDFENSDFKILSYFPGFADASMVAGYGNGTLYVGGGREIGYTREFYTYKSLAPNPPIEFKVDSVSADFISVSWTDVSDREAGYILKRKNGFETGTVVDTLPQNSSSIQYENLNESTRYEFEISAFNTFGESQGEGLTAYTQKAVNNYLTGINDDKYNNTIKVFPNPTSDYVNIETTILDDQLVKISVFDLAGKQVKIKKLSNAGPVVHEKMNLSSLNKGVFFLHIRTKKRLLIQKLLID